MHGIPGHFKRSSLTGFDILSFLPRAVPISTTWTIWRYFWCFSEILYLSFRQHFVVVFTFGIFFICPHHCGPHEVEHSILLDDVFTSAFSSFVHIIVDHMELNIPFCLLSTFSHVPWVTWTSPFSRVELNFSGFTEFNIFDIIPDVVLPSSISSSLTKW